jgi:Fe-S oxidoreductase
MVTREEKHTTRGRAHLLWEMLQGDPVANGWRDENVKEALDLCLSCKGCKGDCPVNVDMATYKAEFLSHYWEGRLRPRYAYAFGWIDKWARIAKHIPGLVNLATSTPGLSAIAKFVAGMPQQRRIPQFAPETFESWFRKRGPRNLGMPKVILWPDTFNNHFFPETARAAVEVLEAAGYQVDLPAKYVCCGRPLYDYGMLDTAKQYLERIFDVLGPQIYAGIPIVALEPSCASVLRDEVKGLFPEREETKKLLKQTFLLGEFLEKEAHDFKPPKLEREAVVHGHCHHKALLKFDEEKSLIQKMGVDANFLPAGCCGMAGSFGFEEGKYEVSEAIGERVLLPAVRKASANTFVIADGFSCREQIEQNTERHALHTAEVMKLAMEYGPSGPDGGVPPESKLVQERNAAIRRSKIRAGIGLAGIAAATGIAVWTTRRK